MATLLDQTALLQKLASVSVTGLPDAQLMIDQILTNLAEKNKQLNDYIKQIKDLIKKAKDPETRKKLKEQLKQVVIDFKDKLKNLVTEKVAEIRQMCNLIIDGLKQVAADVKSAIAAIALPPALGTVTPNPVYALLIAIQVKNALSRTLSFLASCFRQMLSAAILVEYVLPDPILDLVNVIATTKTVVDTIPTPA